MDELTPEQLQAILGTDYETVLADILRRKGAAEDRHSARNAPIGQVGDGQVFFDPAGAIGNVLQRRRAGKEVASTKDELEKVLASQNAGRRTYADALTHQAPAAPPTPPRTVDSAIPGQSPPPTGAPPMAQGAPPALANASQMPPQGLQNAGVPPEVQALLARLRGQ